MVSLLCGHWGRTPSPVAGSSRCLWGLQEPGMAWCRRAEGGSLPGSSTCSAGPAGRGAGRRGQGRPSVGAIGGLWDSADLRLGNFSLSPKLVTWGLLRGQVLVAASAPPEDSGLPLPPLGVPHLPPQSPGPGVKSREKALSLVVTSLPGTGLPGVPLPQVGGSQSHSPQATRLGPQPSWHPMVVVVGSERPPKTVPCMGQDV